MYLLGLSHKLCPNQWYNTIHTELNKTLQNFDHNLQVKAYLTSSEKIDRD